MVRASGVAAETDYMWRNSRIYRLREGRPGSDFANTIGVVPIYEFRCRDCDARFEALVDRGTETRTCPECGAEGAERVMSLPAAAPRLVRTPAGNRRQEERNRKLRETTKSDFKERRKRAREAAKQKGGGS
jgi:putative FmdB family regulatory protein